MAEEDKTIADLEKEYKQLLAKKTAAMREELAEQEKIQAAKLAEEKEQEDKVKFEAAVKSALDKKLEEMKLKPEDGSIVDDVQATNTEKPKLDGEIAFAKKFADSRGIKKFQAYESLVNDYVSTGMNAFIATDSDSGCEDNVDAWEVKDCFASVIWQDVLCRSDFLSKGITVKGLDFKAGCGGLVQIRVINHADPSQDFTSLDPCACMSCVSNAFTTYTLTMKMYGDYKVLCDLDLFTAGDVVKSAVLKSMSEVAQERIDNEIYTNLEANSPTYSEALGAACGGSRGSDGDCCTYTMDLYDKIIDLEADMRAAGYFKGVDPILILSPTVAAYLKYKDGLNIPAYIASSIQMDGLKLAAIGNIKVIESCHANACVTDSSEVQAILIDPSRAIGEAWGKRPEFKTDDDPIECQSQKIVLRMWAAFDVLDTAAIGHIVNP